MAENDDDIVKLLSEHGAPGLIDSLIAEYKKMIGEQAKKDFFNLTEKNQSRDCETARYERRKILKQSISLGLNLFFTQELDVLLTKAESITREQVRAILSQQMQENPTSRNVSLRKTSPAKHVDNTNNRQVSFGTQETEAPCGDNLKIGKAKVTKKERMSRQKSKPSQKSKHVARPPIVYLDGDSDEDFFDDDDDDDDYVECTEATNTLKLAKAAPYKKKKKKLVIKLSKRCDMESIQNSFNLDRKVLDSVEKAKSDKRMYVNALQKMFAYKGKRGLDPPSRGYAKRKRSLLQKIRRCIRVCHGGDENAYFHAAIPFPASSDRYYKCTCDAKREGHVPQPLPINSAVELPKIQHQNTLCSWLATDSD